MVQVYKFIIVFIENKTELKVCKNRDYKRPKKSKIKNSTTRRKKKLQKSIANVVKKHYSIIRQIKKFIQFEHVSQSKIKKKKNFKSKQYNSKYLQ
jgi:hypothetical protein